MGVSKLGEGCPIQARAANAAQGYVERAFPPESPMFLLPLKWPSSSPFRFAVASAFAPAQADATVRTEGAAPFCRA